MSPEPLAARSSRTTPSHSPRWNCYGDNFPPQPRRTQSKVRSLFPSRNLPFPNTIGTSLFTNYPLTNTQLISVLQTAQQAFGDSCGTPASGNIPCDLPVIDSVSFSSSPFRNAIQYNLRVDQYFSKDRLYFSMYRTDLDTENIAIRSGFRDVPNNNTKSYQAGYTHIFSPTLINDFSYGQIRVQGSSGFSTGIPFRVPDIGIDNQEGINGPWGPATFIQNNYNWRDVVSLVKNKHSLQVWVRILDGGRRCKVRRALLSAALSILEPARFGAGRSHS